MRKHNNEDILEQFYIVHKSKYQYNLVFYQGIDIKVKIICPIHGIFEQTPKHHIKGSGCSECKGVKKSSTKEFIKKAKLIHGGKYDYSLVDYKNNHVKIKIICPIHGEFEQTPNSHLSKKCGCRKCLSYTNEEFIKKAKLTHGNKYDYSLVLIKRNKDKVKIICPIHGIFEQIVNNHLNGNGCSICNGGVKLTNEEFIKKAKLIHGNKYDYKLTKIDLVKNKIKIICSIHGEFEQIANNHLNGSGCSICNASRNENKIRNILIENNIKFIPQKRFKDCRDKKTLPFDFYLPDYNTCIEYDGEQHFIALTNWGGKIRLLDTRKKDEIKTSYCFSNNINLIRITYMDNVNEKMGGVVKGLKDNTHNLYSLLND